MKDTNATASAGATSSDKAPATRVEAIDRRSVISSGLAKTTVWSLRFLVIGVAAAAVLWLLSRVWVGVLPVMLALLFSSVLGPLVAWARKRRVPSVLAAAVAVLASLALIGGVLTLIVRPMIDQAVELGESASGGISKLRSYLAGPPLNIASGQIDAATADIVGRLQRSAQDIAAGVFSGVTAVTSGLVTFFLVVILSFLFLKDGDRFLPWLRRRTGKATGTHRTELLARVWVTLGQYIRVQAIVSLVDGVLIGIGPLAGAWAAKCKIRFRACKGGAIGRSGADCGHAVFGGDYFLARWCMSARATSRLHTGGFFIAAN